MFAAAAGQFPSRLVDGLNFENHLGGPLCRASPEGSRAFPNAAIVLSTSRNADAIKQSRAVACLPPLVQVVVQSRVAVYVANCPFRLPPPRRSLLRPRQKAEVCHSLFVFYDVLFVCVSVCVLCLSQILDVSGPVWRLRVSGLGADHMAAPYRVRLCAM